MSPHRSPANHAAVELRRALQLIRPKLPQWSPVVLQASAAAKTGLAEVWDAVQKFKGAMEPGNLILEKRKRQCEKWMWSEFETLVSAAI